jgi:L,D-transpeptidase catalytic domain
MRPQGLDPTNSNALSWAIAMHGTWYVNERVIGAYGMLGRSQGCFSVADASLVDIADRLSPGRLICAGKS